MLTCVQSMTIVYLKKHFIAIYPEELELKKLILLSTFPFEILHMPFFNSNIPLNIFYSFIRSKITRLLRNTSDYLIFVILDNKLFWLKREPKEGYQRIIN